MGEVCVITGGGSGMGLAAAKYMPKDKIILISGRTEKKLERAAEELRILGHTVCIKTCDTSDRKSVRMLAEFAASLGMVKNVVNSAYVLPKFLISKKMYALAVLADERNGYLAGVDILCDGGATNGRHFKER